MVRVPSELVAVHGLGNAAEPCCARGVSWTATTPTMVLTDGSVIIPPGAAGTVYDVSPDGRRFLVLKEAFGRTPRPGSLSWCTRRHSPSD
jgi:hypothetical protein